MYPDVVHARLGHPVAVFDAKYKLEGTSGRYPNADAYQMLAYCTALGLLEGWLVYAQGAHGIRRIEVRSTDVTIIEHPLELTARPADLLVQVSDLADLAVGERLGTISVAG